MVAERGLGGRVVGKQGVDKASWGGSGAGPGGAGWSGSKVLITPPGVLAERGLVGQGGRGAGC